MGAPARSPRPVQHSNDVAAMTGFPEIRVGQGFDVHRFSGEADRVLVLGGVVFPGERGLVGHSDADVITHACADALLGAAGLGDIGVHFPDTDPAVEGRRLTCAPCSRGRRSSVTTGGRPNNIDAAVICESPKIAPRRVEIQQTLSGVVGAPVTLKGNRAERLGAIGRTEGIVCLATALIQRRPNWQESSISA